MVRPAAAKRVRIESILGPRAGPIPGDPNRLHQIFWNLASNAVKFASNGGKVQVLLERVNPHVKVSMGDTGKGIPLDFLHYVFDHFRQPGASATRRHGGLGLGLSIVKQLVELCALGCLRSAAASSAGGWTTVSGSDTMKVARARSGPR